MTSNKKLDFLETIAIPDSDDKHRHYQDFGYFIKDGRYFGLEKVKDKYEEVDMSNFTMKSLYNMTNGTPNSSRLIVVKRYTGEKVLLEIKSSDLRPDALETILKSQRCTFYGSATKLKKIFAHLMDDEKQSIVIDILGWNAEHGFYAFADAMLTTDNELIHIDATGIIHHADKCFYLPPFGMANLTDKSFESEKKVKFRPGTIDFTQWADLFYRSSGDDAIIGTLFAIAASYRDLIFNKLGFFPYLFLFGDLGTGKSQFVSRILALFSADTVGIPLNNSTIVGLNRTVSSICNGIFYFKEFSDMTDSAAEDFMLPGYDGAGRKTGIATQDNKTKDFPIRSAIVFDGNALPRKGSILSRVILLSFDTSKFTPQRYEVYRKFRDLMDHGFGNVLREILSHRELLSNQIHHTFEDAAAEIKNLIKTDERFTSLQTAPDRTIQHAALLLTLFKVFHGQLIMPVDYETALSIILNNAGSLNNLLQDTSITSTFWESFVFNYKKGFIQQLTENVDNPINSKTAIFNIKYESGSTLPILQLKLRDFYPYYVKYCKENGIRYLDQNSLRLIITSTNSQSFIQPGQKSRSKSYTDKKFGSCYQFSLSKTETSNSFLIDNIEFSL